MNHSVSFQTMMLTAFLLVSSLTAAAGLNAKALTTAQSVWRITVDGLVDHPLNLTVDDLKAMPSTTEEGTIYCVSFPDLIVTTGVWTGVSLSTLLTTAGVQSTAIKVAFFAADGYATDLDLSTSTGGNIIVAYEKDGLPLGETLRLVVPGKWGYKWISKLTEISLVDFDFKGTYESQGYSDELANVNSQTVPTAANDRAKQLIPTPLQPTNTSMPSSNRKASNSTDQTPLQNNQNPEPGFKTTPPASLLTMIGIAAIAVAITCAALLFTSARNATWKKHCKI